MACSFDSTLFYANGVLIDKRRHSALMQAASLIASVAIWGGWSQLLLCMGACRRTLCICVCALVWVCLFVSISCVSVSARVCSCDLLYHFSFRYRIVFPVAFKGTDDIFCVYSYTYLALLIGRFLSRLKFCLRS